MAAITKHYAKFCSYCHAKGLPEAQYTNHFVKDKLGKGGKVVCPELLKNECGYCHEVGHTPKFCPKLKARDARRKAAAAKSKKGGGRSRARSAAGKAPTPIRCLESVLPMGQRAPKVTTEDFPALPSAKRPAAKAAKAAAEAESSGIWTLPMLQTLTVAEVEKLLEQVKAAEAGLSAAEQAFVDAQIDKQSQSLEETADGEAFFDNDADVEEAVTELAREQPALARQGAFASPSMRPAFFEPIPTSACGGACCPLPAACDLTNDFGDKGADGWGSDDEE